MNIISADSRGAFTNEWLDSRHSFSFGEYYNPQRMGFSSLRVINEDWVEPNGGFPMHGHRDMEILTYLLSGELAHKDSLGNGSTIHVGEVQRMSAGKGILHSEFNPSNEQQLHLLQIWLLPHSRGLRAGYAQMELPVAQRLNQLQLIASPNGDANSLTINSDARVFASILNADGKISYTVPAQRSVYVHLARGTLLLNDVVLQAGDAIECIQKETLHFRTADNAEFLLFELPPVQLT